MSNQGFRLCCLTDKPIDVANVRNRNKELKERLFSKIIKNVKECGEERVI